jgi:hypothetical protein
MGSSEEHTDRNGRPLPGSGPWRRSTRAQGRTDVYHTNPECIILARVANPRPCRDDLRAEMRECRHCTGDVDRAAMTDSDENHMALTNALTDADGWAELQHAIDVNRRNDVDREARKALASDGAGDDEHDADRERTANSAGGEP